MGCFKKVIRFAENPFHLIPKGIENIIQGIAPFALTAFGQPELAAGLSAANSYANSAPGQGLKAGLISGGTSLAGSALGSALGGGGAGTGGSGVGGGISGASGGGSSFLDDVGNGISDTAKKVGDFTGLTDVANGIGSGLNDIGSSFSNAASDVGNSTGLTDVGNGISSAYNGIGSGLKDAANGIGNYIGVGNATDGFGQAIPRGSASDLLSGATNPTNGSGLLGQAGLAGRAITSLNNSIGGSTTGGSVGTNSNTPSFGGQLATLAGGVGQGILNNQAKNDQLKQIAAQQSNLQSFNPAGITSDPGYQFQYDQGLQGLQRQLAAAGGTQSGGALKAATQYGQNYANNAFNDYYNRWANQTGAQNQLLANKGNVQANSLLGQGQNLSQTLTNAFNPQAGFSLGDLLKRASIG